MNNYYGHDKDSYEGKGLGEDLNPLSNPDVLSFIERDTELHPSPEMMLIREAIAKALNNDQREIWEMHAYDKLFDIEIAKKLKVTQQAISKRLKVIEHKIIQYCQDHRQAYAALKEAEAPNDGC